MIVIHIWHLAGSCFPNCHPTGYHGGALAQSGNAALGAAALLLVGVAVWKILTSKSGGSSGKGKK
jgi:hypothetical protein